MRQLLTSDYLGRPREPAKNHTDVVELVTETAREQECPDAEPGKELRQLGGVPEAVRLVTGL